MAQVVVVIGAGGIGLAIARRQGFGRTILLVDWNEQTLTSGAEGLRGASYRWRRSSSTSPHASQCSRSPMRRRR